MAVSVKSFIGNKAFYKHALAIALPIMIQNGITNFVSMLDNIMVGRIGTEQMSGVAITNQLIFIFNLCIFGATAGAGIFTAQYFGEQNHEGIRHTLRFKLIIGALVTALAFAVFLIFGDSLIMAYLSGNSDGGDMAAAFLHARDYLNIILISFIPFMILQSYSGTLRECNETMLPMKAGIVAVVVNLVLNYILIYGNFGAPPLGVRGAAIATVTARFVETAIVIIWLHTHKKEHPFAKGLYRTFKIPFKMVKAFFPKALSLMINEGLWSAGTAILTLCYASRGLNTISGLNIANTLYNVFSVVFIALGSAISIIVGQLLGAGKFEEAKKTDTKLIAFAVVSCAALAFVLAGFAPFFPGLYNTTAEAKQIATHFLFAQAVFMPVATFMNAAYFTLRSGGKTILTLLFDSVFMWCLSVPVAFILSKLTGISAVYIFVAVQFVEVVKCIVGGIMVKKGIWIQNIVKE
ncbi:MAG: MATE family efflux transporter [Clostridia bacterium]|nr:MATE family efflux transporter [Clostridia bacterium]